LSTGPPLLGGLRRDDQFLPHAQHRLLEARVRVDNDPPARSVAVVGLRQFPQRVSRHDDVSLILRRPLLGRLGRDRGLGRLLLSMESRSSRREPVPACAAVATAASAWRRPVAGPEEVSVGGRSRRPSSSRARPIQYCCTSPRTHDRSWVDFDRGPGEKWFCLSYPPKVGVRTRSAPHRGPGPSASFHRLSASAWALGRPIFPPPAVRLDSPDAPRYPAPALTNTDSSHRADRP